MPTDLQSSPCVYSLHDQTEGIVVLDYGEGVSHTW